MEQRQHSSGHHKKKDIPSLNGSLNSNVSGAHAKKWSFGRLFRKKKDCDTGSSSEDDCKNGFVSATKHVQDHNNGKKMANKSKSKSKSNRGKKLIGAGFDHVVVNQDPASPPAKRPPLPQCLGNEFFLPFETATLESCYQNYNQTQQQQPTHPQPQPQLSSVRYQTERQCVPQKQFSRSSNAVDNCRGVAAKRAAGKYQSSHQLASALALAPDTEQRKTLRRSSSEEELISLNSSTFSKYRSDENILVGDSGPNGQNRRSRAARNERYYKRLSRDSEVSHGQIPVMHASPSAPRWKTQPVPLSVYATSTAQQHTVPPSDRSYHFRQTESVASQGLRNSGRLQHDTSGYVQWGKTAKQPKNLQNSVNDSKRSISYDSHIHLQNANRHRLPPPPPPRDPRRLNISGILSNDSLNELRPISYAFDSNGAPIFSAAGRCVSDDKIWESQTPFYQSAHSLNVNLNHDPGNQMTPRRRLGTRAERQLQPGKRSMPNGLEMHYGYIAEGAPRSRKPIHLLDYKENFDDLNQTPPSSGIVRTTKSGLPSPPTVAGRVNDFGRQFDGGNGMRAQDTHLKNLAEYAAKAPLCKPRSASSSRLTDLRTNPHPLYSEVRKSNGRATQSAAEKAAHPSSLDEVDHIVCGSLHIKPSADVTKNYVEIRRKEANKSRSMPNHYQRHSGGDISASAAAAEPKKYEEYVSEKREKYHHPLYHQRDALVREISGLPVKASSQPVECAYPQSHKKPANLEEAIDELEAIYKSLHFGKESGERMCKERVPTPGDFEKFVLARADSYDDDDSPAGEPDPVHDDVAYRSIKLVNLQHKTPEKQPPFGIPLGPIVPSSHNDYLHVTPDSDKRRLIRAAKKVPDIVKDDLAVRALRKDDPGCKQQFVYHSQNSLPRKNRASRTQSANIYALIQRDAAKPSGGDLFSYMELPKGIDRYGSMTSLQQNDGPPADIPCTLKLLRDLKEQESTQDLPRKVQVPFRHPKQVGAICQLPEALTKGEVTTPNKPIPLPRSTITPEPTRASHQLEDALNKIAKDAQESSARLSKELRELRKEALITSSRVKTQTDNDTKAERRLQNIQPASEETRCCDNETRDAALDGQNNDTRVKSRKLHKEGKLIKAIDQVSEAANAVCEKILKDIEPTGQPAMVQDSVELQTKTPVAESLVMPNLFKNLSSIKSEQIEDIASRCMRQISELTEAPNSKHSPDKCGTDPRAACNEPNANAMSASLTKADANLISTFAEKPLQRKTSKDTSKQIEEIDKIIRECEAQVAGSEAGGGYGQIKIKPTGSVHLSDDIMTASNRTASRSGSSNCSGPNKAIPKAIVSSLSSSSDCLAKSSSPSANRGQSSSITSFHPYSSSDYIKSPSSEYHAPSTDPIKTFSTTSYDAETTSATPNNTTSTFSYSPSPPLNLTPVDVPAAAAGSAETESASGGERRSSSSPLQYNSSEELAMIFGIEEQPKQPPQQRRRKSQQQKQLQLQQLIHAGNNVGLIASMSSQSTNHASSFARNSPEAHKLTNPHAACDVIDYLNVTVATTTIASTTSATTLTTTTIPFTNVFPSSSSKLETKSEIVRVCDYRVRAHDKEDVFTLSPNFNKIYARKVRIILDQMTDNDNNNDGNNDDDDDDESEKLVSISHSSDKSPIDSSKKQLEEETSSNPDSGNVSLADYPLFGGSANACLHLQTMYNSRFEVRNSFVNEVCIERDRAKRPPKTEVDELDHRQKPEEFPPLPTEEELRESLREEKSQNLETEAEDNLDSGRSNKEIELADMNLDSLGDEKTVAIANRSKREQGENTPLLSEITFTSLQTTDEGHVEELNEIKAKRKTSIVYETPKLKMSISEIRIMNYDVKQNADEIDDNGRDRDDGDADDDGTMRDDHAVVEDMPERQSAEFSVQYSAMQQRRRRRQRRLAKVSTQNDPPIKEATTLCLLHSWQSVDNVDKRRSCISYEEHHHQHHQPQPQQQRLMNETDEKPTTSSKALTMLGENRPANSLTVLEQMLVACSLGVITSNDIFTLFLIIIGVITIVAIILF